MCVILRLLIDPPQYVCKRGLDSLSGGHGLTAEEATLACSENALQ